MIRQVHRLGWGVVLLLASCQAPTANSPVPAAAEPGAVAPDCTFIDQAGAKRRLSEFKGKAIVLTEWAATCSHCQVQLPKIQNDLYRLHADKGIAFVNVEIHQATASDVAAFATRFAVTMPLAYDDKASTRTAYPVKGYPTSTVISPEFRILGSRVGEVPTADLLGILKPYLQP
jgi:peroxiredoxin